MPIPSLLRLSTALLCLALPVASAQTAPLPKVHGQFPTVPGTLFNNTLPAAQFKVLCDKAAATARATGLTDQERWLRIKADGGVALLVYAEVDSGVTVTLGTPTSSVYAACAHDALVMDRRGTPELQDTRPHGGVALYIQNPNRKLLDSFAETEVKLFFLDSTGAVIREVRPRWGKEGGKPIAPEGTVTLWPANYLAVITDDYKELDVLAPDFARASFLRLDFTQDGVRRVMDFKIDRP